MRQGGNFLPLPVTPTAGKFNFTVLLRKGRRVRWFLNRIDDRNYDLIELDKKTFYRSRVTNGKTTEVAKVPHNAGENGPYQIQVEVSADTVTHSIRRGGSWAVLDTWHETGRDLSRGTFGFLITGRDEMGLADFSFQPR